MLPIFCARHRNVVPILYGCVIIILVFISGSCHADPVEDISTVHYEIDPIGVKDIYAALMRNSTIRYQGKTYFGYTKWDVRWHYQWIESSESCQIVQTQVYLTVVHTMPRLSHSRNFDTDTIVRFDTFYEALMNHESGHYQLGLQAARKIEHNISKQPGMSTCRLVEEAANQAARKILKDYAEKEKTYDRETGYGQTQGAWIR